MKSVEEIKNILTTLNECEKVELQFIVLELMKKEKLTYQDITSSYIEYLQHLKRHISDDYQALQSDVIKMWCGKSDELSVNLKETMHHLLEKGRINTTHEKINEKF